MRPTAKRNCLAIACLLLSTGALPTPAQEAPKPESNYVKLLKKAPEARMGAIVDIIGKRGDSTDLAYLFARGIESAGFPVAIRLKAFEALIDARLTRDLRPDGDLDRLGPLIQPTGKAAIDPAIRVASARLAGLWKLESALAGLISAASADDSPPTLRASALDSIAAIGGDKARAGIEALAGPGRSPSIRASAVAALARIDLAAAADRATGALTDDARIEDVTPLIAAFLDRRDGPETLAAALGRNPAPADGARLALRAVYALGRADESLVAALSKSAGIEADPRPLDRTELERLMAEVAGRGNPARGEAIFRRPEMNCTRCHAISGASGGVGPELSALGLSSPVDYVIYSLLLPDQSIKEEYQTRVVLTDDGRVTQGIVVDEDDKRIILRDATGSERLIPASTIEDSKKGGSLMPKGLANLLTRAEFVDLVRYLSELGKPGRYAIKATPTIQRWRALKPIPETLAASSPDPAALTSEVLNAEPARWVPLYAWTDGSLPTPEIAEGCGGGPVAYLQGELAVSSSGPASIRFGSSVGLSAWIDDHPIPGGDSPTIELAEGRRRLTIRVDLKARGDQHLRVEVAKVAGSPAEFAVVGGR